MRENAHDIAFPCVMGGINPYRTETMAYGYQANPDNDGDTFYGLLSCPMKRNFYEFSEMLDQFYGSPHIWQTVS